MEHEHVKKIGQFPNHIHDDDPNKDVYGNGSFYKFVDVVQKDGHKKDINKINDPKIPKFKFVQGCELCVNLTKYS